MRIDYEHSRTKLASGFTTRKDLGRVNKNAVPQVLGLHPLWGALATVGVARTQAVMQRASFGRNSAAIFAALF